MKSKVLGLILAISATALVFIGGALDMSKIRMLGLVLYGIALYLLFFTGKSKEVEDESANSKEQASLNTNSDDANNVVANKMSGYDSEQR